MSRSIDLMIPGHPATQGSKRHVGKGRLIEMDKKLPDWRKAIAAAATETTGAPGWAPLDGPLAATVTFYMPRPARPKYDEPATTPDLDKLQRALGDGLTLADVIHDDARIVRWDAEKVYATETVGAIVTVTERGPQ